MTLYAVFRTAIYRHECAGVFSTVELAEACAVEMRRRERDAHHDYEVLPVELDVLLPEPERGGAWEARTAAPFVESPAVLTVMGARR